MHAVSLRNKLFDPPAGQLQHEIPANQHREDAALHLQLAARAEALALGDARHSIVGGELRDQRRVTLFRGHAALTTVWNSAVAGTVVRAPTASATSAPSTERVAT